MIRLSLRFLIPLLVILAVIAYALAPLVDRLTLTWAQRDTESRSRLIAVALKDSLVPLIEKRSTGKIESLFTQVLRDERLLALAYCDPQLRLVYKTNSLAEEVRCEKFVQLNGESSQLLDLQNAVVHVASVPVENRGNVAGYLILVHDMSFVARRGNDTKRYIFYLFLVLAVVISFVTIFIAQVSWRGWMSGIHSILRGEGIFRPSSRYTSPELAPLLQDMRGLIRDLESEKSLIDDTRTQWSPKTLKEILQKDLAGEEILIVSNREPYMHVWNDNKIEVQFPASGLVTALEPIMRACSGTWIAHGSGNADRKTVDKHDHVQVPPEKPAYQIRRVWLTEAEEKGYYYGFANEGLWPLCHIAHARPIFRSSDWAAYVRANQKFAKAVIEESKTPDPVILVQDYHFALLPKMIREKLPKATIITFWHIPWPNAEAFSICPWKNEILAGLLGSTVVGFHTKFHSNNFIETVDRALECRIDLESSTISYQGEMTAVRQYPISIEWPPRWLQAQKSIADCRSAIRRRHQLADSMYIGVGVDRLDYTKGIPERFHAVDRLLEQHPEWRGRFCFIQISAPSRVKLEAYQNFQREVRTLAEKINFKYRTDTYQPIILVEKHHEPDQVFEYFRGADLCVVSSLHDGMNLVAKEFIAARDDEQGALILSQFTGASRELPEALIVNPYNVDQCGEAIYAALEMSPVEQRERMRSLRGVVKEFNIFRWAGRMLLDAARIRSRKRLVERMGDWEEPERRAPRLRS